MRSRWLSTFSILGILLIILGIVGKVVGHRFIYDPGQIADGNEAWYYLIVGVIMLVNGLVTPAQTPEEKRTERAAAKAAIVRQPVSAVADNSSDSA